MNFHDLIACRANAEHGDRALDDALKLFDVVLNVHRQLLEGTAVRNILGEAVELLVNRLAVNEVHEVRRELGNGLAVLQLVCDADLELRQAAQRVDLVDDDIGQAVYADSVACNNGVEPAGAARAAGNSTELAACVADVVAGLVEQLGRERAFADTGGVGLEDA